MKKNKADRYAEQMIEKMITKIANEESQMGKDFRLRFEPSDPAGILRDEKKKGIDIRINGDLFASFMDEQDKKGRISMHGARCFFVFAFFSNSDPGNTVRMMKYVRENDFSTEEFQRAWEEFDIPTAENISGMENNASSKMAHYVFWKAVNGDRRIRESMLAIYKRAFRKEYNVIKKFRKMDYKDVLQVISDDDYEDVDEVMGLARILFFAAVLGIEVDKPAMFLELFNRVWDAEINDNCGFMAMEPLPKDYELDSYDFEEASNLLEDEDCIERATELFDSILSNSEVNSYYSLSCNEKGMERLRQIAPFYVAAMNETSFEADDLEKMYGLVFSWIVNKAKEQFESKMLDCEQMLGITPIYGEDYLKPIWETSAEKVTPAQASKERNLLLEEIESLRSQLDAKNKELQRAIDKISSLEKDLLAEVREKERFKKMADSARKEEAVATLQAETTDDDDLKTKELFITKEEKLNFLKTKKFCIVGGHQNWTYKVRELFPEWVFIKKKATATTGDDVVNSVDRIFFFTDILSHVSYARFVGIARTKGIPCSYLHAINMDRVIDELYEEGIKLN